MDKIPNYIIAKPSPRTKQYDSYLEQSAPKKFVGSETYSPKYPHEFNKGIIFGQATRKEINDGQQFTPAPNHYSFSGDFDFRDPTNPNSTTGKTPKFAYGIKPVIKSNSIDFPGAGTYFGDGNPQPNPMNQKNVGAVISTAIRQ